MEDVAAREEMNRLGAARDARVLSGSQATASPGGAAVARGEREAARGDRDPAGLPAATAGRRPPSAVQAQKKKTQGGGASGPSAEGWGAFADGPFRMPGPALVGGHACALAHGTNRDEKDGCQLPGGNLSFSMLSQDATCLAKMPKAVTPLPPGAAWEGLLCAHQRRS